MPLFDLGLRQNALKTQALVPLSFLASFFLVAMVLAFAWARGENDPVSSAATSSLHEIIGFGLPALAPNLADPARSKRAAGPVAAASLPRGGKAGSRGKTAVWDRVFLVDLDTNHALPSSGFDTPEAYVPLSASLARLIAAARARLPDTFHRGMADALPLPLCVEETAPSPCGNPISETILSSHDGGLLAVVAPARRKGSSVGRPSRTGHRRVMVGTRRLPSSAFLHKIADAELEFVNIRAPLSGNSLIVRRIGGSREIPNAILLALLASMAACGAGFFSCYATYELAKSESLAIQLAGHDRLSGLPNRSLFNQFLDVEIARSARKGGGFALLYLDLDRVKEINDSLGHDAGDRLIVAVAHRIRQVTRASHKPSRLEGDEFAILQTGVCNPRDCEILARRLLDAVNEPFDLGERRTHAGISIGIALCPQDAFDRQELMRRADLALYRAKSEGRNRFAFFEARTGAELRLHKSAEDELRQAIDKGRLTLLYQPFVAADSQKLVGVEALVRWPHPTRGLVQPDDSIRFAEDRGLILPLGEWVLRRACGDARNWGDLRVAVNVPSVQFRQKEFVATVAKILKETRLDPSRLELELTEDVIVDNPDQAENAMIELRAMGVRLVLDDFGTGFSSLIYLRRFAFDKIKIDRSLLESVEATGESAIIVYSIVHLGRALGLTVTAEGIETPEQRRFLQALGCHELQGYLFSRPVSRRAVGRMAATGISGEFEDEEEALPLPGAA